MEDIKAVHDVTYLSLIQKILDEGIESPDRTGTGTKSLLGLTSHYPLSKGFPLLTTKKVFWKGIKDELLFFLQGPKYKNIWQTSLEMYLEDLKEGSKQIWAPWAKEDGSLGRIYGAQWRAYGPMPDGSYLDQITELIENIKKDPYSRRHIVTAWAPQDRHNQALPACHTMFQCFVRNGELSLLLYQRSADMAIGVPFNIASYALLTYILASLTGLKPGSFIHSIGDAHVYLNHVEGLREQLQRPLDTEHPTLSLKPFTSIDTLKDEDIVLEGYKSYNPIRFQVSV